MLISRFDYFYLNFHFVFRMIVFFAESICLLRIYHPVPYVLSKHAHTQSVLKSGGKLLCIEKPARHDNAETIKWAVDV